MSGRVRHGLVALLAIGLGMTVGASAAAAQGIQVHGLLDIAASGRGAGYDLNILTHGDSPYDPFGLRVFGEGTVNPRLAIFTQGVIHDASSLYMEGAYVVFTPQPGRDLHAMAGKIPWPIGTFAPRSYSDKNPLIGKPLMYSYPTTLLWYATPPGADAMLAAAGSGFSGGAYSSSSGRGMVVVDDEYWDTGAAITGSVRPLEFAAGVTNGTPGWGNTGEDENHSKTVLGRAGVVPVPGFRAGISAAYGAYLIEDLDAALPPGKTANDYHQKLGMADAEVMLGHGELRAEGYANAWETPNLGDLRVNGGYVEGRWTLLPGWWAAARGEVMRFSSLRDSTGLDRPWDHDRDRIEAGIGYRPDKAVRLKATWQHNVEHMGVPGAKDRAVDFLGLLLTVGF